MNKRSMAPFLVIIIIVLSMIAIYCLLYIPIPKFKEIRTIINYFLIIILWIILQVGLVYGYVQLGKLTEKGIKNVRNMMTKWSMNIRRFIIFHS